MYYGTGRGIPKCKIVPGVVIEPDFELLKSLLYIQTPSGEDGPQEELINWIYSYLEANEIEYQSTIDEYGNLYITKGEAELYPCIVAHLDINQDFKVDFEIFQTSKFMFGFDNKTGQQCGLGFDDKVGVCFALQMLLVLDTVKVFLPKDEEVGCMGTREAYMGFFDDCSLCIQLDRRSYSNDISSHTNGVEVVSPEFKMAMREINLKYSYSFERCVYTDVGELKKQGMSCVAFNVSCGYFEEHSDQEVLSVNHFTNAINYGYEILSTLGDEKWYHITKIEKQEKIKPLSVYNGGTKSVSSKAIDAEARTFNWDEEYFAPVKKQVWHDTPEWTFTKQDEDYIEDCLSTGTCPLCTSTNMETLADDDEHCYSCDATFNIPVGKTSKDVEMELLEILEEKRYHTSGRFIN